jgi:hypothetical protein
MRSAQSFGADGMKKKGKEKKREVEERAGMKKDEYSTEDETATTPRARSSRRKIQEEGGPRHKGEMNAL